jgi:hypothetical protein
VGFSATFRELRVLKDTVCFREGKQRRGREREREGRESDREHASTRASI